MYKKNDKIELDIEDMGKDCEGIARLDGYVFFIKNAMKGEKVLAQVLKVNKNYGYAKLIKVLKSSPYRVVAKCPYYDKCGGCHCMHIDRDSQLECKKAILKNTLKSQKIDSVVLDAKKLGNDYDYRNKLQLPIGRDKVGNTVVGFFRENSNDIVDIDKCIVSKNSEYIVKIIKEYIDASKDLPYFGGVQGGNLRHIIARTIDNHALITIVTATGKLKDRELFTTIAKRVFNEAGIDFGIYINHNNKDNNVVLGLNYQHIYGLTCIKWNFCGLDITLDMDCFLQINNSVAQGIYEEVLDTVTKHKCSNAIDCYSGIGILSANLAKNGIKTTAIELNKNAVEIAKKIKLDNNILGLDVVVGDVDKVLPNMIREIERIKTVVVLDPPRKGCDRVVLDAILQAKPFLVVYISCNPATLTRDLLILNSSYDIMQLTPYDMFVHTKHTEVVVTMIIKESTPHD